MTDPAKRSKDRASFDDSEGGEDVAPSGGGPLHHASHGPPPPQAGEDPGRGLHAGEDQGPHGGADQPPPSSLRDDTSPASQGRIQVV
jgi:hypothetical protein